ncbi:MULTISPECIES: HU family DNA-binding protein [Deinococcus]|uniref:HU family DNA-binding protein n=1 Tax=Deinococcus petrolearius TaxID=1751295 RepID=A0ABW1DKS4_9DEIO|nr:HU family DNA-binding protein [Deinococcus gobiensis]
MTLEHDPPEIGAVELAQHLQELGHSRDTAHAIVDVVCAAIALALTSGHNVTLRNLGTFRLHPYMPRPGLPSAAVTFQPAPELRDFLAPPARIVP